MRRVVAALAVCCVVVFAAGSPGLAHEGIATSEPKAGERVDRELRRVVATFGVDVSDPMFRLLDPDEDEVATTLEQTGPDTVVLEFEPLAEAGEYVVQYRADGADGHEVAGAFAFTFRSSGGTNNVLMPMLATGVIGIVASVLVLTWWFRRTRGRDELAGVSPGDRRTFE